MPDVDPAVVRLIDASLNRASEGVRVVEDYARFVLGDGYLSRLAKVLRHGLSESSATIPFADRLAARDTPGDVGTRITTDVETRRADAWEVCVASLQRLQEALRSLEEYGKTIDAGLGARFERLRYDAYTLAKAIGATRRGRERFANVRLYVLVDGRDSSGELANFTGSLCEAGVDAIQLRDKSLDDRTLVERARTLVAACRPHGVLSIVNDRPDVAAVAAADGVHVGQEELTVADARRIVGANAIVGVSTHAIEQARAAVRDGADYLGVGPTFPTPTKSFDSFPGLDYVHSVADEITLPAFAIGGVAEMNLPEVLAAGATRVAVSSAVTAAADPPAAAKRLRDAMDATLRDAAAEG
ncbi:MAG: thiamine phosphate synthase [Planctomycetota bacterium]